MSRLAIMQSCYIPWKGYFDLMRRADQFILYDAVQYTKQDWRNRNRIKLAKGLHWLTIPVHHESLQQRICDTVIDGSEWAAAHWETLRSAYMKAPHYAQFAPVFEALYAQSATLTHLSDVNKLWLEAITKLLGISTPLVQLTAFERSGNKSLDLIRLCKNYGADVYISGPAARDYIDLAAFDAHNIQVEWMDYSHYPSYPVMHPPFEHHVSILDLLFHTGDQAMEYIAPGRIDSLPVSRQ